MQRILPLIEKTANDVHTLVLFLQHCVLVEKRPSVIQRLQGNAAKQDTINPFGEETSVHKKHIILSQFGQLISPEFPNILVDMKKYAEEMERVLTMVNEAQSNCADENDSLFCWIGGNQQGAQALIEFGKLVDKFAPLSSFLLSYLAGYYSSHPDFGRSLTSNVDQSGLSFADALHSPSLHKGELYEEFSSAESEMMKVDGYKAIIVGLATSVDLTTAAHNLWTQFLEKRYGNEKTKDVLNFNSLDFVFEKVEYSVNSPKGVGPYRIYIFDPKIWIVLEPSTGVTSKDNAPESLVFEHDAYFAVESSVDGGKFAVEFKTPDLRKTYPRIHSKFIFHSKDDRDLFLSKYTSMTKKTNHMSSFSNDELK